MTMPEYLEATAFAVERVIEAVWYERDEFEKSRGFVRQEVDDSTWNAYLAASMSGEEDQFWSTYSGLGQSQLSANNALAVLAANIHRLSAAALGSALLQIAKQGIATVHGGPMSPSGRPIGTQSLSVVIWEARNQAMHWEDVRRRELRDCFETLARDVDPKFGEYRERSLAFDVVELLGWRTVDSFNADLVSLG
jgi:hypothetical protein